jgi:hypothetical protein
MRFIITLLLIVVPACTVQAQTAQQGPSNRETCIRDGRAKFTRLIDETARTFTISRPQKRENDYMTAPRPTAFAACINWDRSTPEFRSGTGTGFASGRTSSSQTVVDSEAIRWCAEAPNGQLNGGNCRCEVMHRNGGVALQFPVNWPRECN